MLDHVETAAKGVTLVEQVIRSVQGRIASRKLVPGARLPSVRLCAASLGVSKSTVVEAYERLVAEGAITARRGSGFFVAGTTRPLSLKAIGPELDRAIDPLWLTRQSMQAPPHALKPGSGWLPASWMPDVALQRGLRQLAREPVERRSNYDEPQGYQPLRLQLARRLGEHGSAIDPDNLILTDSASQALDLLCRFLLAPGDTVLVDDPGYFNFHALLRAHRVRTIGVPQTPEGPDLTAFAEAITTHRPRLYIANAGPQNPTGVTLSPITAHRILKLAEASDLLIIEDDIFSDFEAVPGIRLAALDGYERVIQIGSFAKTVTAAIRCGYIALRAQWVDPIVDLKLALFLGNSQLAACFSTTC